ncbi:hypothetical protein CGRA01v4_06933 [Colletotrichum graminicola]|nr:hypothetical protein CGRA01v4_06933 [Colletotrichum graminicola]
MGVKWTTTHTHTHTHTLFLSISLRRTSHTFQSTPSNALTASPRRAWFQCNSKSYRILQQHGACRRDHASRGARVLSGINRGALTLTERSIEWLLGDGT